MGGGPLLRRQVIERRIADRAEEHRVGPAARVQRLWRQRGLARPERRAAHQLRVGADLERKLRSHGLEDPRGRADDLGTDPVTRKEDYL